MQRATAAPRDALTSAQVSSILTADAVAVEFGADQLDSSLNVVRALDLLDGEVERVMAATYHGTCKLTLGDTVAWGVDLVRPWQTITDQTTGLSARFNLGAYVLTTPEDVYADTPRVFDAAGYDRLYLLGRLVGDSYRVTAGTGYLAAVRQVVTDAGLSGVLLDGTAGTKTLPSDRTWPLLPEQGSPSTWLDLANDLLGAIGYRGLWADENGYFRSEPYQAPASRPVEWALDADSRATLVGQERRRTQDVHDQPNAWRFIQRNLAGDPPPAPVEGVGIYTVPNTIGGLIRWRVEQLDAADQTSLVAQGDRMVAADRQVSEVLSITTAPLPLAGHFDVMTYTDSALGTRKVQASRWTQRLAGGDTSWTLEVVA